LAHAIQVIGVLYDGDGPFLYKQMTILLPLFTFVDTGTLQLMTVKLFFFL